MASQKPSQYLSWNPSGSNSTQPPDSLRARGYQQNESPVAAHFNWELATLDNWIQYLDSSLGSTLMTVTLDSSMRLIGGGTLSYVGTTGTFAWSAPMLLSIPSVADADNAIAAGNVIVQAGQVIYVQANYPFTSLGDVTSGTADIRNVTYTQGIVTGQQVTGSGIPSGTTVISVAGTTVTLSSNATITSQQAPLTYAGTGALTVKSAAVASLVPSSNTVILGRATLGGLYLGVNSSSIILRDGEQKRLLETGFHDVRYLPAGVNLGARQAVYLSSSADGRTAGAVFPADASQVNGALRSSCIGFVATATTAGSLAPIVTGGILGGFTALTVASGLFLDPTSPGSVTATKPTGGAYVVPVGYATDASNLYVRVGSASGAPLLDPSFNSVIVQPVSGDTNTVQLAVRDNAGTNKALIDAAGNQTLAGTATVNSLVSAAGIKTQIGPFYVQANVSANNSLGSQNINLPMLEANLVQVATHKMPFTGSLVGLNVNYRYTATQGNTPIFYFFVTLNGNTTQLNPNFSGGGNGGIDYAFSATLPKGSSKFVVNDGLAISYYTSSFTNAATVYIRANLWVETLS